MPKKAERMSTARSSSEVCRVSFIKAVRSMMSPDYAKTKNEGEFLTVGNVGDKGYVNFTKVSGKNVEGEFAVELTEETSKKKIAVAGKFSGVDQQVGSKGFN
jgi:tRNA G37 N-methylase TrmD